MRASTLIAECRRLLDAAAAIEKRYRPREIEAACTRIAKGKRGRAKIDAAVVRWLAERDDLIARAGRDRVLNALGHVSHTLAKAPKRNRGRPSSIDVAATALAVCEFVMRRDDLPSLQTAAQRAIDDGTAAFWFPAGAPRSLRTVTTIYRAALRARGRR